MPLVGGDMCPIAIDVVEKFQIIAEPEPAVVDVESPLHSIVDEEEHVVKHVEEHVEDLPTTE